MDKVKERRPAKPRTPKKSRSAKPVGIAAPKPESALLAVAPAAEVDFAQFLTPKPKRKPPARPRKPAEAKTPRQPGTKARKRPAARQKDKLPAAALAPAPARAAKQRGLPVDTPPVILLPDRSEPLVIAAPEPAVIAAARIPLPRSRAVALPGSGGLLGLFSRWLDESGRRVDRFLAQRRRARLARAAAYVPSTAPAANPSPTPNELDRLRAENEALRRQVEALLAVQQATATPG